MIKVGRPEIRFVNRQMEDLENIDISISHCKEFAIANVIAIWRE